VAAWLCFKAWQKHYAASRDIGQESSGKKDHQLLAVIWGGIALISLLLGVNKQLDLQTWLTEVLRDQALANGWYADRRRYQVGAIAALAIGAVIACALGVYFVRRVLRRAIGPLLGLICLILFVLIRAASFHKVDFLLMSGTIRLNWVFELGGIATIAWFAYAATRRPTL